MGYRDATYVIFDGDNDKWAYGFMKGWRQNEHVDFDFRDAHDLDNMTGRAQGEAYVKARLRERMRSSNAVLVLIGDSTKNLFRFVRWELELAQSLGLPIVAVNLNNQRAQDPALCPAILRDKLVMHVAFKMKIIKHALDYWPSQFKSLGTYETKALGGYMYNDGVYRDLGL